MQGIGNRQHEKTRRLVFRANKNTVASSKLILSSPSNYRHTEKLVRKESGADVREAEMT